MGEAYDVFVSYSSRDRPVVEEIAKRLRDARVKPWFDRWELTAGASWQQGMAAGMAACRTCAVCVGPGDIGNWSREELEVALVRAADDPGFRVFLVLLPGLGEAFDADRLSPFLVTRTWVDLRDGADDLQPLINAVNGIPPGVGETPSESGRNPYRGLRPFEEDDADLFFGRDVEARQALENLRSARFLAVVGASGSGKSSLVRAGVIPMLREWRWQVQLFKPGAAPLEALAVQIEHFRGGDDVAGTRERARSGVESLHLIGRLALTNRPDEERIVLVVDQFEEVFTRCRDDRERRRFIENLVYAATAADGRIVIVLTLRADFYSRCAAHPELSQLLTRHQLLIGPMGHGALSAAIEQPARLAGGELEAGLVPLLIGEVEGRPGTLPLLEHTLYELWEHRRGRLLTLEAYQRTGGVAGAVAHRAEMVFSALSDDERRIARRTLLRLTEPGDGTEDTRRRALLGELVRDPGEAATVDHVVGALTNARLLTTDDGVVDVSHEALIRGWPRLRHWIDEDREGLRVHRRVTETADEWVRLDRDPGLLFRGARLAEALAWRVHAESELNAQERAFLDASGEAVQRERARERRHARRLRSAVVLLLVALAGSLLASAAALRQRTVARENATTALARQLTAQARVSSHSRIDDALLKGLAALHLRPTAEHEAALAEALTVDPRLTAVLVPHGPEIIALKADAHRAVSVDSAGTATRWDLERRRAAAPPTHLGPVSAAAISDDLATVAAGTRDGRVRIWDTRLRQALGPATTVSSEPVWTLRLDRAGTHLLASSLSPGSETVWETRPVLRRLTWLRASRDGSFSISPDGERIATLDDGELTIRSLKTREVVTRAEVRYSDLDYTPDGRRFVGADQTRSSVLDLRGRVLHQLPFAPRTIEHAARRFAGFDAAGDLRLTDSAGRRIGSAFRGLPLDRAAEVALAGPDRLLTAGLGGTLALWSADLNTPFSERVERLAVGCAWACTLAPNGRLVALDDYGNGVELVDPVTGVRPPALPRPPLELESLHVSPGGRLVAGVVMPQPQDASGAVVLWDRRRPKGWQELRLPAGQAKAIGFARDERALAAYGSDGSLALWNLDAQARTPRIVWRSGRPSTGNAATSETVLRFARDGRRVFVNDEFGHLREVNLQTGRARELSASVVTVAFAEDDETAVTLSADGRVDVWTVDDWHRVAAPLTRVVVGTTSLALSPDGRRLAIADRVNAVTIWDTAEQLQVLRTELGDRYSGRPVNLQWAGRHLVALGAERLGVWDLSLATMREQACAIVNRTLSPKQWKTIVGTSEPYAKLC